MITANDILFRASSVGYIMSGKNGKLSETGKAHLADIYASAVWSRREDVTSKYLEKGNKREEDAITLLSVVTNKMFKKNTIRKSNQYITGEHDLEYEENGILETIDTKTSWSLHTFLRAKIKELNDMYYWQGQSYVWLTSAKKHTVAYCLVNGTLEAIEKEKRLLGYQHGMSDDMGNLTQIGIERMKQIEINHIFDLTAFKKEYPFYEFQNDLNEWHYDIPAEKRVNMISFDRKDEDIIYIQKRVVECRQWINDNLINK